MKNCLILSGQYRTFDKTCGSIKTFVDKNNLDVYCAIWNEDNLNLHKIEDVLSPQKTFILHQEQFIKSFDTIAENILKNNPKQRNEDKLVGNASMNFCRKVAYELVPEGYDIIVSSRYDVSLGGMVIEQIPPFIITPTEQSYGLLSDIFGIVPTQFAKHYFLFDVYEKLHSTKFEPEFLQFLETQLKYPQQDIDIHVNQRYCPHMMLLRNLFMNNVPVVQMDLPVGIQR